MQDYRPIGEILLQSGKITREQLDLALKERKGKRQRLGEVLIALGYVSEDDITQCLSRQYGFEVIDSAQLQPDPETLKLIDPEYALSHGILPIRNTAEAFECVIADPIDVAATDLVMRLVKKPATFFISTTPALRQAIRRVYGLDPKPPTIRKGGPKPQTDRVALLEMIGQELGIGS